VSERFMCSTKRGFAPVLVASLLSMVFALPVGGQNKVICPPPRAGASSAVVEIDGKATTAQGVYHCSTLTAALRCSSNVADDTAHLSESPDAVILPVRSRSLRVTLASPSCPRTLDVYVANERSLLDHPRYKKLAVLGGRAHLPNIHGRSVLVVIVRTPSDGSIEKDVWLVTGDSTSP
jgi:hypothetical protein